MLTAIVQAPTRDAQVSMLNPVKHYRLARWLYLHRFPLLPKVIQRLSVLMFHCYIPYTVEIGDGFEVGYWGLGIVVHPRARIGSNVFIAQCVTIGGRSQGEGVPRIGDEVYIGPGARILGDISIGRGSVIGANAVVTHSVSPRTIVAGVPARVIRENIDVYDYTGWPPSRAPRTETTGSPSQGAASPRILHMIDSLNWGGSERQLVEVARRQSQKGYRVTLACLRPEGPLRDVARRCGISVIGFSLKKGLFTLAGFREMLRLAGFLHRGHFDVVHTHDLYSNLMGVPAAWLAQVPVIISSRRDLGSWWWYTARNRKILKCVQRLSTFVVANSEAVRDYLLEEDGFSTRHVRVIRNGVDIDAFASLQPDRARLLPFVESGDKLVVLLANMNVKTKGHADLIAAAPRICKLVPEVRFLLVGEGAERAALEAKVEQEGLPQYFHFLGSRNDVPALLACCDLSVLPSWAEGMPNALIESMAAGLPVVATAVGGIRELVDDGTTGLLVPPHSSIALAKAIVRLLQDPELARRFSQAGQERVRSLFSFDRVLNELGEVYQEAWMQNRSKRGESRSFATTVSPSNPRVARVGG